MQNIYQAKYRTQFPDEDSLNYAKMEWCKKINSYGRDAIHQKLDLLRDLAGSDDQKTFEKYGWPNIPAILNIHHGKSPNGINAAAYVTHEPAKQLPRPGSWKDRQKQKLASLRAEVLEGME